MKKRKIMRYSSLVILAMLSLSQFNAGAQAFSEKRTFRKTVAVKGDMTLDINNKYGNITVTGWKKDSISVTAEIEATAENRDRIRKMIDGVSVNISETDYSVIARTEFNQSLNMFFESFKGMTRKLIPYDSRIQINYTVRMPENTRLKIVNKYGDIYLEDNSGKVTVSQSNGSFKASSLTKGGDFEFSFCDVTVDKIGNADIDASFSEINLTVSGDLRISSVSSKYDFSENRSVSAESRRDKFNIGTTGAVTGNSYFTDFLIDKITDNIDIDSKYGTFDVDLVGAGIKDVNINEGYSDIYLTFDPSLSYNLDIRHTNASVILPDSDKKVEEKRVNQEKDEYLTYGTVGKKPGSLKVRIEANRGRIHIK